jgi:hypothetical protein
MPPALAQLGRNLRVDEAGVAVDVADLLHPVVDQFGAQPAAAAAAKDLQQDLVAVAFVALDGDLAEPETLALGDRNGQVQAPFLARRRRGLGPPRHHLQLRFGDLDVLVAGAAVDIAHLVEVLAQGRRVVDVALEQAGDRPGFLGLLHSPAQGQVAVDPVALELDLADPHPVALVDREYHSLLARRHVFEGVLTSAKR